MIDTDKYEGCQTDHSLTLHKGGLCPTIFMDVDGSGKIVPTLDRRIVDVQADIPEHYLFLLRDAPLLLQEVKRLREEIIEFADWIEEKVIPYMTNEMHEVVPAGGMVSDLHKMVKGD